MTRPTDKIEFYPSDTSRVSEALGLLVTAGDGWINLLPGVTDGAKERATVPGGPFALFGSRVPATTMCTLMPPKAKHRGNLGVTIGIMHPRGRLAAQQLKQVGEPIPDDWHVRQDNARRGLVVQATPNADAELIVQWAIRAGTALCAEDMTGSWQAIIYQPTKQ